MSGGEKAAAIIALAVVAMLWFNWRLWRRMQAAKHERAGWTDADFDAQLIANGVDPRVPPVLREVVRPYYGAGVAPHPDDDFARFLSIDDEEVVDLVEQAWDSFGRTLPDAASPEELPPLKDLRDLAQYLDTTLKRQVSQTAS